MIVSKGLCHLPETVKFTRVCIEACGNVHWAFGNLNKSIFIRKSDLVIKIHVPLHIPSLAARKTVKPRMVGSFLAPSQFIPLLPKEVES